ncbi:proteasome endopeptidase complex, beta subunit [Atractiella rhizophila]|nr:proteasome endopeptidase complex, beta subunit [Atractiella rhizophila]
MTGTSVIAMKFKGGIIMAADTLGSYGSLARFRDVTRIKQVGESTIIGAGGDLSDWQNIQHTLEKVMLREKVANDGHTLTTSQIYEYLARLMYGRRSKFDPLWNALLVGGMEKGVPFLGYVDLLGTTYSSPTLATGFGNHLAQPLLRRAYEIKQAKGEEMSEEEAREVIEGCLRVLFYRDARSLNKFIVAIVDENGTRIEEPKSVDTEWNFAEKLRGYGAQTQ